MSLKLKRLAVQLERRDSIETAEAVREHSVWYIDIVLVDGGRVADVHPIPEWAIFDDTPDGVDARLVDTTQQHLGIARSR